jgi:hypothetical protein
MNPSRKKPGPSPRVTINIPVEVSGPDIDGREVMTEALAVNVSRSGACLRLGFEAPLGATVVVRWKDEGGNYEAQTRLRWKQQREGQWHAGVEALDPNYLWAKLLFYICKSNDIESTCVLLSQ